MKIEVITTNDGSNSLFVPELNETYHSRHGAIAEAQHVFIKKGIDCLDRSISAISVLEIGFGTGLNALLTAKWSENNLQKVLYTGIELNPVSAEIISKINYGELITEKELFFKLHEVEWESFATISPTFHLLKSVQDFTTCSFNQEFDLIYFDAFAPNKQEEMWSKTVFEKLFLCLKTNGRLTTYCAQGQVKRTLKEVGFKVTACEGPPGKREMTIATKTLPK